MTATILATGRDWGRYFQVGGSGSVTLNVQVTMTTSFPRATGASNTTVFVNNVNGIDVFEQSAAWKVRTGTPGSGPDILINMNPDYLHNNLFFESNPGSRSTAIPSNRTDAYSVFVHELGHAFAFNGWRNPDGSLTTSYQSTWDRFVTVEGNGDALFRGSNAMAVYGNPVAVTTRDLNNQGNPNHYGNVSGTGADLVANGLMNGVVFNYQQRYSIGALDLAIAKDAGLTLVPFSWAGGNGAWTDTAKWNVDAFAGANAVVPNGTPFDARIAAVSGTPYTVTLGQSVSLNSFTLASADATVRHTHGVLAANTSTLSSGTYQLDGGQIGGGNWVSGGGTLTATSNTANAVLGASLGAGVLDLSGANSFVRFGSGTAFTTAAAGTTVGTGSLLVIDQASLTRGTITLAGGTVQGVQPLTLEADTTIGVSAPSGTGSVGGTNTLTNRGILQATGTNSALTLNPTGGFVNTGTVRATSPTARVDIQLNGATLSNSGTVAARGTVTGNVTNTGGSFLYSGTVTGALVVNGGTVGTGPNGPGILSVGSASFRPGGVLRWQVKDWSAGAVAGVGFDQLAGSGTLDLSQLSSSNRFTIQIAGLTDSNGIGGVSGFSSNSARSWVIARFANDLSGVPSDRFVLDDSLFTGANNPDGGTFTLEGTAGGDLVLNFVPVPEPIFVLGVAAAGLAGFSRLWQRKARTFAG